MGCCGHGHCHGHALTRRRWMWGTALSSVGALLGGGVGPRGSTAAAQTAETASTALDVLRKSISVDVHTHGGTSGITSQASPNDALANGMRAGSLAVACLGATSLSARLTDRPVLPIRHSLSASKRRRRLRSHPERCGHCETFAVIPFFEILAHARRVVPLKAFVFGANLDGEHGKACIHAFGRQRGGPVPIRLAAPRPILMRS